MGVVKQLLENLHIENKMRINFIFLMTCMLSCQSNKRQEQQINVISEWNLKTDLASKQVNQSYGNKYLYSRIKGDKIREKLYQNEEFATTLIRNCNPFFVEGIVDDSGQYYLEMRFQNNDTIYTFLYIRERNVFEKEKYTPDNESYASFLVNSDYYPEKDSSYCICADSNKYNISYLKCYIKGCN